MGICSAPSAELSRPTAMYHALPEELQAFNRLQSSTAVLLDRLCQCSYCPGGRDPWCLPLHHLLAIFVHSDCKMLTLRLSGRKVEKLA